MPLAFLRVAPVSAQIRCTASGRRPRLGPGAEDNATESFHTQGPATHLMNFRALASASWAQAM
jgi:hypothetical protein